MAEAALEIKLRDGTVRGRRLGDLRTWRGIPYAAPPVGRLRLRAPQPVQPWTGVRDATEFGLSAPQGGRFKKTSEDCLTLNVVAPTQPGPPRPVMVFIHGGAYISGSSANRLYRGHHLVKRGDIVYVSINYRIGGLGYIDFRGFSTPDNEFDVNCGLRDQVAALQWVRDNIAEFGGDPDNVTIFGESSGGNAVTTLMCTPSAHGLFRRGIAESPPSASTYGPQRAQGWADKFVEILGGGDDPARRLRTASVAELVAATEKLTRHEVESHPGQRATAPVIDGEVLPVDPLEVFAAGKAAPLPLIIGTNAHEGRVFPKTMDILPTTPARITKMFSETDDALRDSIIARYPGYPDAKACAQLAGDVVFWEPAILVAQGHSAAAPTWSYNYQFAPRLLEWLGLGATHATELFAVFGIRNDPFGIILTLFGGRSGLREVTETFQKHWLHFAHHGTPAPGWEAYDAERRATLIIDEVSRMEDDPLKDVRESWIGYKHRR
ncbi:carboxylesterase/lipase family protein [Aldersonia kunmingensis]|uniref:carboxylesterase/lipase family protein n=1 Tax=Aldersonia kunmingensis TaxID=408066 RepID=UPI000829B13D|nr:carboxylesterase/lipase family protein [Aldersonia kunmingensis]